MGLLGPSAYLICAILLLSPLYLADLKQNQMVAYLEQMCVCCKSRQIFALVTSLQILHKCLGLIARGVSLGGNCAHLLVTGG